MELTIETLVKPESCEETVDMGDTIQLHYTGKLEDGRVIDSSLSRDPLVVVLGKKQVIPGLEKSLLGMCVGEKRKVVIPPGLAYGKRGYPPSIPGDAVLEFETEVISLSKPTHWQTLINDVLPMLCIALVPTLLALIGYHLYSKSKAPTVSKKKLKEEKRNKAKRK
ncbi:peptidyl-prolyl cis-trans isomerase FKBP11 [Gastrophryne carolinensis]